MENTENNEITTTPVAEEKPKTCKCKKHLILACIILAVILILAILISTSKPMRIHKFVKFTEQVEKDYPSYTEEDLDDALAKYEKISKKLEKCEFNDKQKDKVFELKRDCHEYFTQAKGRIILQKFQSELDAAGQDVKDAVKSMSED